MREWFWIVFSISIGPFVMALAMCMAHQRPVRLDNDSGGAVRMGVSPYKLLEKPVFWQIKPNDWSGVHGCSNELEFAYLATRSNPEFVAYRIKDICDVDTCSCDIKVSYLEKHRRDLSVPWSKAGSIFPPGARR